jgi:DNA-binding NarL/FixJ family response regulator
MIKVALFEDNEPLRQSLSALIEIYPDLELLGAYRDANNVVEICRKSNPDVVVMDLDMPGISGIQATELIQKHFNNIKVLILTVFDDDSRVFHSICAGAVGYLLKKEGGNRIMESIKEVFEGGSPITSTIAIKILKLFKQTTALHFSKPQPILSDREKEILEYLTKGNSYKMIANACNISIDTVRFHIKKIYEKLHVHSMTEAVSKALKENLI